MLNYCGLEISGQRVKVGVINLIFGGGFLKRSAQFFDAGQESKEKTKLYVISFWDVDYFFSLAYVYIL